jgi:hypothetical protein
MSAWAYDVRILQGQATRSLERFWPANNGVAMAAFERLNAVIILIRGNYSDVAFWAETAIAMAGTATEQLVSLQPLTLKKGLGFSVCFLPLFKFKKTYFTDWFFYLQPSIRSHLRQPVAEYMKLTGMAVS